MLRVNVETIGDRVRLLRKQRGLGQSELAELLRVQAEGKAIAVESLSKLENNKHEPSTWLVAALAVVFDTTTDYLLGLRDDPGLPEEPRFPVPAPDMAPTVARLNRHAPLIRATAAKFVDVFLSFVEMFIPRTDDLSPAEVESWFRLYSGMTLEQRQAMIDELEERVARHEAGIAPRDDEQRLARS